MSSPPISDDEIEDFIAEQKARLQHERERTAFQPPPPGAFPSGPVPVPANGPRLHPNDARLQAHPEPGVFRARDANGNVFDKIVRVDAEEVVPQDAPLATLPIGDHGSLRERMKAEMNREYNDFLRAQEERARARRGANQASAARPPPAPARRPPGPPPAFSAQSFATTSPSNVQTTGRSPQPPQYAHTFLTEVEPPPPRQQPPPPPPPPPPNEMVPVPMNPGFPPNFVRAPNRRDAQLEELAERVRELRTLNAPPDAPPPELVAPYGPPPPPTRTVVQTVMSDSSTMPPGGPYRVFPGPSPGESRTVVTEGYVDPDSDDFFATLPIRDRNSAKQRANVNRNREYNDYLRMKEEVEKQRLLARRAGADSETGLLLPSQAAQDLRALPPPGYPPPGIPQPTMLAPTMMHPGYQQPVPVMSVPMSAPSAAQPIIVVQGDSRPYATLRQSRSLSNLAALGDPFGVDSRLHELDAELDRTKRRLLGMSDVGSARRVAYGGPVGGSLVEAAPPGFAEGPYAVDRMARPSQHLAGSGALLMDGPPGIFGGELGTGDRRRKAEYGRELLAQIEMNREGRRRAKSADLQVDITGYPDIPHATRLPEPARAGPLPFGGPPPGPGRSPMAFGPTALPPSHDLYDYFASHHPLDISLGGAPMPGPPMGMPPPGPGPMVGAVQRIRPDVLNAGMALATDEERKHVKRAREQAYQMELQQQIDESMRRKERDIAEHTRYNAQKEAESSFYSPFGRGGGGAPLRDPHGNVITNLRQVVRNPMAGPPPPPPDAVGFGSPLMPPPPHPPPPAFGSPFSTSPRAPPTNAFGEAIQARGGHGIFGTPLTDEQKAVADRYKDELRMQIEDKRARAEAERQRQAEEEARENRRLAEQQERIHIEMLEEERQRKMKDVAEQRRKDDMERQLAAANEQNAPRRRRDRAPTRNSRQGGQSTFRFNDDPRPPSPPVPALRNRMRQGPPSNREDPPPRPAEPVIYQDQRDPERDRMDQDRMDRDRMDRMDRDRMDRDRVDRERDEELQKIAREREELERERAELERERQRDREDEVIQHDRERTFQPSVNVRFRDLFDDVSSRASTELGVMDDLAKLRSTLQNEKLRIETELEKEARRIQVNDPRLEPRAVVRHLSPPPVPAPVHMPVHAPAPMTYVQPTPVFEAATHRQPVIVHHRKRVAPQPRGDVIEDRDLDAAMAALTRKGTRPENIDHFRTLRRRERQFKERFPETPQSDLSLEEQQEALIETQKRRIRRLRARNRDDPNGDPASFDLDQHGPRGAARSERYPEDGRRHMRDPGSAGSFNPDRIVQRNERRLRHLREATSREDLHSMRNTDDILDKYVYNYDSARGRGTRRDNRTPEDDSWLYS